MKREISEVILERIFESIDENGVTGIIKLQIGKPYFTSMSNAVQWRCPFQIIGIGAESVQEGPPGVDGINALLISLQLTEALLGAYSKFSQKRITWLNEEDLGLSTLPLPEAEEQVMSVLDAQENPFRQAFDAFFQGIKPKDTP